MLGICTSAGSTIRSLISYSIVRTHLDLSIHSLGEVELGDMVNHNLSLQVAGQFRVGKPMRERM